MRAAIVVLFMFLCSATLAAQGADGTLRAELEALHAKWFKAFDSGDGATMDQMETDNVTIVMPNGALWAKTMPRGGKQPKRDPQTQRTLSDVSVRQFGDTAVLTGILTTKSAGEGSKDATTVVFVQRAGKWLVASAQWTSVVDAK